MSANCEMSNSLALLLLGHAQVDGLVDDLVDDLQYDKTDRAFINQDRANAGIKAQITRVEVMDPSANPF